jgi:hypothetical protein
LLQQIDSPAVAQLSGDSNWGAGVTLSQAQIAFRRHHYDAANANLRTITPVFTRMDADPYQKRAFDSLKAALEKPLARN